MVTYFCPNCWAEFLEKTEACPRCGYLMKDYDSKDYVDKLINSLSHSAGEIKHRAVMILAFKKEKRALPYLREISDRNNDPSLRRAAQDAVKHILES